MIKITRLKDICNIDLVTVCVGQFRESLIPSQGIH